MFNSIYFNGNEYKEMWLNGNKIWEKNSGSEIVYPYADADCVVTYMNTNTSAKSKTFTVIDSSLPYSINGEVGVNSYTFPYGETKVKLVNLKPMTFAMGGSTFFPINIEQLRLPNLTDLSYLFYNFCYDSNYTYSWSPQYFEFNQNPTNMSNMFNGCYYLTDDMMAQLMPYFPNTSQVTDMRYMFYQCKSLTKLDLSFDTSKVTTMIWMFAHCESLVNATLSFNVSSLTNISNLFRYCYALSSVDLSSWNTSTIESHVSTFGSVTGTTVHVGDGWTLGTESTFGSGTDLVFMRNDEVPTEVYGDIVLSTSELYVTEGVSNSSLGVKLSQSPTNAQTVTYSYTSDYVTSWSGTLTFDSTNWNTYQYVAFTPALDGLYTDRTDTITFTSDNVTSVNCTIYVTNTEQENTGGGDTGDFPYPDVDSVITYRNTSTSSQSIAFDVIDNTLPYSINGVNTNTFTFPASSETQVKFVNLKPRTNDSSVVPINIEQLRIPNLTDLSNLFCYFGYNSSYEYSWSPQYFEFHPNPTVMEYMFYYCSNLTDDIMTQFMPYFPNTSEVTNMSHLFASCNKLTSLDVSSFDTSKVTNMEYMFGYCNKLTSLDVSSFDTSNVTTMEEMFYTCSSLTSLDLSNFDTSNVTNMKDMFRYCSSLTELDLFNFDTSKVTNMNGMFQYCSSLTSLVLSNFDTREVTNHNEIFSRVKNCTIYIGENWTLGTSSTLGDGTNLIFITYEPITSISLSSTLTDTSNVTESFTIIPTINPNNYSLIDLKIVYDETYMNIDNNKVILKDGCQGQTLSITYRSKENNSISDTLTFTVSQDLEFVEAIDFTQSTAPTLPNYMTVDYNGTYSFSHGLYTTDVYGLIPSNKGVNSSTAYTRYKYVAPARGDLTFTYRCCAETNYDYLTVHVDTSTSQPSTTSATNQVFTTKRVSSYETTDGTASVSVVEGTTYYIHIQYYKDSSQAGGYDKGCIRKIELL